MNKKGIEQRNCVNSSTMNGEVTGFRHSLRDARIVMNKTPHRVATPTGGTANEDRWSTIIKIWAKLAGCLLLPCAFFLISPGWLERQPSLCLSRLLFKRTCPGCGITRALAWAVHGKFDRAWRYNKRIVVVLPLLSLVWIRAIMDGWHELKRANITI